MGFLTRVFRSWSMGNSAAVQRRQSSDGRLYGESNEPSADARAQYTPAQLQAMYLSRGRPDMGFMSDQAKPAQLPEMQQTFTVKNHVNLKKATLKLMASAVQADVGGEQEPKYDLEFGFDATKPCRLALYLVANEKIDEDTGCSTYSLVHKDQELVTKSYPKALGNTFKLSECTEGKLWDLSRFAPEELSYQADSSKFPLIIVLEVEGAETPQSQSTFVTFAKKNDKFEVKMLKQKIQVDNNTYELQEIYGMDGSVAAAPKDSQEKATGDEAKTAAQEKKKEEVEVPDGAECIICLSEPRNTTVLPCRHMCLCSECAETLRMRRQPCPVCRTQVESLLLIRVEAKAEDE